MTGLYRLMLVAAATLGAASPAWAEGPGGGEVTAVSLTPAAGKAEVIVTVQGAVEVRDFMLNTPDRLVLDVVGAHLNSTAATVYDGVNRGGVTNLRYSQFRPDVVRIVLDLDGPKTYQIDKSTGAIRVSFGPAPSFQAWSSESASDDAVAADAPAPAAPAVASTPARAPEVQIARAALLTRADEPRITVTWDRASIADVVAGFAAFSGRTIILGKDVKGEVTAEIKNQPWPQAFQAMLATQGLSAQEMSGGIIRVDAPATLAALDSLEPLETSLVRINYAQAGSLCQDRREHPDQGPWPRGRRHRVQLRSSSPTRGAASASVTDFVRGLDIRTPQLSIQAKIIFVDRTDIEQLGVKYDLGNRNQFFNKLIQRPDPSTPGTNFGRDVNIVDLGGNSVAAIANADAMITGSALDLVFSTSIGGFTLTTFLRPCERTELADVQAEPVISTLDNRQADILVGEETPVRVIDASSGTGNGGVARATVQFKETGIRLTVTPHVTEQPSDPHAAAHRAVGDSCRSPRPTSASSSRSRRPTTSSW